jgi:hypothetical protein
MPTATTAIPCADESQSVDGRGDDLETVLSALACTRGFAIDESAYPPAIIGRRRRRSASRPDTIFIAEAVASATPSIRPTAATGGPNTPVVNSGTTGYNISEAAS